MNEECKILKVAIFKEFKDNRVYYTVQGCSEILVAEINEVKLIDGFKYKNIIETPTK